KDDLFHALMSEEEAALRDRITGAIDNRAAKTDLRVALREAVQATFEYFDDDRASAALLFRDSFTLSGDFERHLFGIYGRLIDEIEGAIGQAQRAGMVRDAPAQLVAFGAAALISQMAL